MENQIAKWINDLKSDKIITIPTETVFGYAASLYSEKAIRDLMKLKSRDFNSGKVFTLVPENKDAIRKYAIIPKKAEILIDKYIPGEITLILPKNPEFKNFYFDHFDKIGIRIPNFENFDKILNEVGPILLTSANPKGGTPKLLRDIYHRRLSIVLTKISKLYVKVICILWYNMCYGKI